VVQGAKATWDEALALGEKHGYRNAQATVLAPTGTIGLMMDCDTTGIEPDLALVKYKKLVGGGLLKIVNHTVPQALRRLGYGADELKEIIEHIDDHDTIEGAPHLQDQHLKVFDCAFKPINGQRSIAPMGHVRMMAGVQPFISGSQSKTVNLPSEASVEDIAQTHLDSWKLGLKCIAIYRDGCKRSQPLSTSLKDKKKEEKRKPLPT
jgi:ribonucleoside-diphosphate reductase alpha chain